VTIPRDDPIRLARRDVLRRIAKQALLIAGSSTGWLLEGAPDAAVAADAPRIDDETATLLNSVIGVDMHSHAAGVNGRPEPTYDLAAGLRTGRMTAVCLCHATCRCCGGRRTARF